ncbi:helix-turn-helix domain-containing protein [Halomonas casei]|uniref:helix-turn-helix domain-containing protein n=1 Tax=Halomonas TaxID=2745 RepID=UPI003898F173
MAKDIQNVSKACKLMDYSRQQFYEIRRNYQTFGSEGLGRQATRAARPLPQPGQ